MGYKMETKRELYKFISNLKEQHAFALSFFTIQEFCKYELGIRIGTLTFRTEGLRGMSMPEKNGEPAVIILSEKRNAVEQDFDCIHELIHVLRHPCTKATCFRCYDKVRPNQNAFYEWEANEGAAEFLMPYKSFIPTLVSKIAYIEDDRAQVIPEDICEMAEQFHVTDQMVMNRISGLRYEILQYLSGVALEDLDIRSLNSQKRAGINYSNLVINPSFDIPRVTSDALYV